MEKCSSLLITVVDHKQMTEGFVIEDPPMWLLKKMVKYTQITLIYAKHKCHYVMNVFIYLSCRPWVNSSFGNRPMRLQ